MFDRDRHSYITFGWVATIIALLLFGALLGSKYPDSQKSAEYAYKCAEQYQNLAERPALADPTPSEEIEATGTKKDQYNPDWCDLAAQQSMAESTYWMNWAAIATTVFTGVGAFLIWQTLLATQDTVAETRRIGEAQVRAYVSATIGSYEATHHALSVRLYFRNFGQSPAINLRVEASGDWRAASKAKPPAEKGQRGEIAAGNEDFVRVVFLAFENDDGGNWVPNGVDPFAKPCLFCKFEWEDVFRQAHVSYCMFMNGKVSSDETIDGKRKIIGTLDAIGLHIEN